jgi:hypothetical protein
MGSAEGARGGVRGRSARQLLRRQQRMCVFVTVVTVCGGRGLRNEGLRRCGDGSDVG